MSPLLKLDPLSAILIISFIITVIITLVYKFATDQTVMKKLKDEMKHLQKEVKALKDDPKKAMAKQKIMMEKNMQYMKQSFKPTLYTFLPIILIFGWLNAHMAYHPIVPNTPFEISAEFYDGAFGDVTLDALPELTILSNKTVTIIDNKAMWRLQGEEADYLLSVTYGNEAYNMDLKITEEREYAPPEKAIKKSKMKKIKIHNPPIKIDIFGLKLSWLWAYIIFSIIISTILRKVLKLS